MTPNKALELLLPGSSLELVNHGLPSNYWAYVGRYRGYWVLLEPGNGAQGHPTGIFRVTVNASLTDPDVLAPLEQFLAGFTAANKKIISAKRSGHAVVMELRTGWTKRNIETVINPLTEQLIRYLEANQIPTGCQSCGDRVAPLEHYIINNNGHYICPDCAGKVEQSLKENQAEVQSKKSNLPLGIVGALLGGLLGVALWFAISRLGYISAISGVVMAFAACKGYEKLGKALDLKGVIVSGIIVLALAYFAHNLCWAYDIYAAYDGRFGFFECFGAIGDVVRRNDLTGDYYRDLALGYFFTIVGASGVIWQAIKDARGSFSFRKNEL